MKSSDKFPEIWDVKYTDVAEFDLDGIYDYISENLTEPDIAVKQINRIIDAVDKLDQQPLRHRLYDDEPWRAIGLRVMVVDNYSVFYLPVAIQKTVWIIRIMYSRRDFNQHLKTPNDYDLEIQ
ncbi:MAG: type II toxin-antitoxin system RelE/ParE family toxin [Oscillospiraceae bacterium]|nr:type II toxin-antitoxin system RelE/ParE family toxin [Oscillospiraceae bacterium]